jgi:hypothetical protein
LEVDPIGERVPRADYIPNWRTVLPTGAARAGSATITGRAGSAGDSLGCSMPERPPRATAKTAANPAQAIEAFLAALEHPHRNAIDRVRALIREAAPSAVESVKWNAPSFALPDHFATFQLRAEPGVLLIMHFGAKKRAVSPPTASIADPTGLLTWLAEDRATIRFANLADVEAKHTAFVALIRSWIGALTA